MKKLLALLLTACMLLSVTAVFAEDAAAADIPLVVAENTLSQKFSPFFADTCRGTSFSAAVRRLP